MASSAVDELPSSSPLVPNASLVTMEAKMMVATGHGHCQQLKDMLISKEDASTMVVVMALSNQSSKPPEPPSPAMDYRLLAAACSGSFQDLESLVNGKDHRQASGSGSSAVRQAASGDVEAFLRESLLDGVTPTGDTLLHVVATCRDCTDCLKKAGLIHKKAERLLFLQNNKGDTPLHCAAGAANSQMVSFLISLAKGQDKTADRVKELLGTENKIKETALHEAVRVGNNGIVKMLMEEHPQLASLSEDCASPLYLAISLGNKTIAETLYQMSDKILSYSGPNGQNALHAAVLRGKDLTKMLVEWNKDLTIQRDERGNTPLHFVASVLGERDRRAIRLLLLDAKPDALYQPDNNGSFPIHVAASVGAYMAITDFLEKSPTCAGLRDARGRTFLHVAVDKKKMWTNLRACWNQSLSWILNMQDKDGNTALHLAVQAGRFEMCSALLGNRHVHLDLTNEKGETALDIAWRNIPNSGIRYNLNNEVKIQFALSMVGAKRGICRRDYLEEADTIQARQDKMYKLEDMVKEATQNLCIGSVLVATVTFGASFAMPGGYRADDHTNGGTPTLAGRYAFDAFTLANALAFTWSAMATISLMSSGSPIINTGSRSMHLCVAYYLMSISVTSLVVAFALGTYMMLAPVAHNTAVAVCVLSSVVLVYQNSEAAIKSVLLVPSFCRRTGICSGIVWTSLLSALNFVVVILVNLWPIAVIICLTAALNYPGRKVEPAVQPPTPLA